MSITDHTRSEHPSTSRYNKEVEKSAIKICCCRIVNRKCDPLARMLTGTFIWEFSDVRGERAVETPGNQVTGSFIMKIHLHKQPYL